MIPIVYVFFCDCSLFFSVTSQQSHLSPYLRITGQDNFCVNVNNKHASPCFYCHIISEILFFESLSLTQSKIQANNQVRNILYI